MDSAFSIPAAAYHNDPCPAPSLTATLARIICQQSCWHAKMASPRTNPDYKPEVADHFDLGNVAHDLLLEGNGIVEVIDAEDWRTKAAKEARDAARKAGKIPLLPVQWRDVQAMVKSAREQLDAHKEAPDAFTNGKPEQALVWQEDGIWCRSRLDWLSDDHLRCDDYKSTGMSAEPDKWIRTMFAQGYDIQAGFYLHGMRAVFGADAHRRFRFIVQETYPPYALSVISLAPDALVMAEKKVLWAIEKWAESLKTGEWPGYPKRVCHAETPGWLESAWVAKELEET